MSKLKDKTNLVMDNEDGTVREAFRGMGSGYSYLTHGEFIRWMEVQDFWNVIEPDAWRSVLSDVGLDYDSYDNPDDLWDDYTKAVNK